MKLNITLLTTMTWAARRRRCPEVPGALGGSSRESEGEGCAGVVMGFFRNGSRKEGRSSLAGRRVCPFNQADEVSCRAGLESAPVRYPEPEPRGRRGEGRKKDLTQRRKGAKERKEKRGRRGRRCLPLLFGFLA